MKKLLLSICFAFSACLVFGQKLTTSSAVAGFDATTPIDKLPKAENKTVIGSLDTKTGAVQFEVSVNNFAFSNPTMQSHFISARWMNSAAFPKMTFTGKIDNLTAVKFKTNGTYTATVSGNLTIKGVTKKISTPVKFVINAGKVSASTSFSVALADYGISEQRIESGRVARVAKVTVSAGF